MVVYDAENSLAAIADSIPILIIINVQQMGSKIFIRDFYCDYNKVFNSPNYLRLEILNEDLKRMSFVTKLWALLFIAQQSVLLVFWNPLFNMIDKVYLGSNMYKLVIWSY